MINTLLDQEKQHLASLLEAIQRCVYFLDAASSSLVWPLNPEALHRQKKNKVLFGALAALNERFAKLQDTLGAAMRHTMGLLSEPSETFLRASSEFVSYCHTTLDVAPSSSDFAEEFASIVSRTPR